jgi:hypothetical protein
MSLIFLLCFGEELELKLGDKQTDSNQKIPIWIEIRTSNLSNQVPNSTQHQRTMILSPFQLYMIVFGTNSAKNSISKNKEEYSVKSSLSFGKKSFCQILRKFWGKILLNFHKFFSFWGNILLIFYCMDNFLKSCHHQLMENLSWNAHHLW